MSASTAPCVRMSMRFDNHRLRGRYAVVCAALLLVSSLQAAAGRRVTFRAEDGGTLTGVYYEASQRPAPAVLLLPMQGRSPLDWDAAASQLADAGFAVLALDFRGDGDAAGYAADVRGAKAFLRSRPDAIVRVVGVAGASMAANVALIDAADDPSVASIALLSPGLDYKGLRIEAAMKKYGGRPALLISSTKDPYAARSIRHLATIGPGTREVLLDEAVAHGTVLLARSPGLIGALVDWFKRTL